MKEREPTCLPILNALYGMSRWVRLRRIVSARPAGGSSATRWRRSARVQCQPSGSQRREADIQASERIVRCPPQDLRRHGERDFRHASHVAVINLHSGGQEQRESKAIVLVAASN